MAMMMTKPLLMISGDWRQYYIDDRVVIDEQWACSERDDWWENDYGINDDDDDDDVVTVAWYYW